MTTINFDNLQNHYFLDDGTPLPEGVVNKETGEVDTKKLLELLLQFEPSGDSHGTQKSGGIMLERPSGGDFSADEMALTLMALNSKSQEGQLKTAKTGLEISMQRKEEMHKAAMEKLQEAISKASEAADKDKASSVLNWISKIAVVAAALIATVAAVVATVATAGAAAPLLGLAALGLVAAGMDLANHISQSAEPPGPQITISGLMTQATTAVLTALGMSEEDAEKLAPLLAGIVANAVTLGTINLVAPDLYGNAVGALMQLCGCSEEAAQVVAMIATVAMTIVVAVAMAVATGGMSALDGIAKTATVIGRVTQAVAQGVAGATKIASGIVNISSAESAKLAEMAHADKAAIDKTILTLRQQMEDEQGRIKELLEQLDHAAQLVSQMIQSAGQTRLQTVRNMV